MLIVGCLLIDADCLDNSCAMEALKCKNSAFLERDHVLCRLNYRLCRSDCRDLVNDNDDTI